MQTLKVQVATSMGNGILPALVLVEDNPDDQRFFLRAMRKAELPVAVTLASDGEQAIDLLSRPPDRLFLIVSDVHLPRRSGWDVLGWVRSRPPYLRLPFVLWTSLPDAAGVRKAMDMGANSYLAKPIGPGDYRPILSVIEGFLGN